MADYKLAHLRSLRRALLATLCLTTGCAGMSHTDRGALVGSALGGLGGAIIGHQSGNTGAGMVLGAGAGMIAGAVAGSAEDAREERDWALDELERTQYQQAYGPNSLTNADLIYMSQNGLADDVIINAVRSRGGRFDLDPTALVQLKQSGVSDRVLAAIQSHSRIASPPVQQVRYVERRPRVVVVEPQPTVHFSFGSDPHCHRSHWHHHHSYYW
ncbi:MAG: hypothetical protein R3B90_22715 [Planctomycetaceae bacterium]